MLKVGGKVIICFNTCSSSSMSYKYSSKITSANFTNEALIIIAANIKFVMYNGCLHILGK